MCEIIRKWLKIKLPKGVSKNEIVRPTIISTLSFAKMNVFYRGWLGSSWLRIETSGGHL
jgi:hypothetical protein